MSNEIHPLTILPLGEDEETKRGALIAEVLGLRKKGERYNTSWGTKTDLGLYRTMLRIIIDGN